MASFRRRRRDGAVQEWKFPDCVWLDAPADAPERFLETRDPKTQGMIVLNVDEFEGDGPPTLPISVLLDSLGADHG